MKPSKALLAVVACAPLLLTACGNARDPARSTTADPTPTASAQPTVAPTAVPTAAPTGQPTLTPTVLPTVAPTATQQPTPAPTTAPTAAPTATPTPQPTTAATKVEGPLDPLQTTVIDDLIVAQVGSQLPAPVDGVVECVAASLNYLVDVPDAVLAGAEGLAAGADPYSAFNSSALDAQASLQRFVGSLQAALTTLVDRGECSAEPTSAQSGNPLAGTPLKDLGAALSDLNSALEDGEAPDLNSLSDTIAPLLVALAAEMGGALPAELSAAPVLGGVFATSQQALLDIAALLGSAADYDAVATSTDAEQLIDNLLRGLLIGSLPVGEVDPATEAQLTAAVNTLSATLGSTVGLLVTPLFNEGLEGVADPLLDPVDGFLAAVLAGGNPLDGVLAAIAGDNGDTAADAYFGLVLSTFAGTPLQNLIAAAGGTTTPSDSPLALLGALQAVLLSGDLDTVLGTAVEQNDALGAAVGTILDTLLGDDALGGLLGL